MTATGAAVGRIRPAPGTVAGFSAAPGQALIKEEFRTLIWSEPLSDGGRAVIKMYRQQPFYDPARRWFIGHRGDREYRVLSHLTRHGVPCPEPLWWSSGHDARHGRYDLLATREIEGAIPLDRLLRETGTVPELAPLLRLARRMHDSGVAHGAFVPRNVLVSLAAGGPPAFHVIDTVRSHIMPGSIAGSRMASFDLLDLLHAASAHFPQARAAGWLADYGLGEADVRRLMDQLARHRPGRPWRHLRRAERDARALLMSASIRSRS